MEDNMTRFDDELQHHGIKGQRWGVRRYQNSDGTLTNAGKKRYNKELEKLKAEEEKIKAAEKVAANKKRTQNKIDKLEAKRQELEQRKLALKGDKKAKKAAEEEEKRKKEDAESLEEKRERLLKSTDAAELYKNKDILSNNEINDRINRIDLESRLQSKIVVEKQKTGMDYVNSAKAKIDAATGLYKSIDSAYSAVTNSAIGKTIMNQLGIETPKKKFSLADFAKNMSNESDQEIASKAKRVKNEKAIREALAEVGQNPNRSSANNQNNSGMSRNDVQSMIDDAIDDAIRELQKG